MLVYVTSDDSSDDATRKLEDVAFKDERVGIGAKFFKCIKVNANTASEDRLLKANGKSTPRLLVIKRNYEVVAVLEGKKLSTSKINKAMAKACKSEYKTNYGSMLSNYAKLLNKLDRLDDERVKLSNDAKRLAESKKKSASKEKKYKKAKAAHDKAMEDWKKAEEKLLTFKLKELKRPTT